MNSAYHYNICTFDFHISSWFLWPFTVYNRQSYFDYKISNFLAVLAISLNVFLSTRKFSRLSTAGVVWQAQWDQSHGMLELQLRCFPCHLATATIKRERSWNRQKTPWNIEKDEQKKWYKNSSNEDQTRYLHTATSWFYPVSQPRSTVTTFR